MKAHEVMRELLRSPSLIAPENMKSGEYVSSYEASDRDGKKWKVTIESKDTK